MKIVDVQFREAIDANACMVVWKGIELCFLSSPIKLLFPVLGEALHVLQRCSIVPCCVLELERSAAHPLIVSLGTYLVRKRSKRELLLEQINLVFRDSDLITGHDGIGSIELNFSLSKNFLQRPLLLTMRLEYFLFLSAGR